MEVFRLGKLECIPFPGRGIRGLDVHSRGVSAAEEFRLPQFLSYEVPTLDRRLQGLSFARTRFNQIRDRKSLGEVSNFAVSPVFSGNVCFCQDLNGISGKLGAQDS